MITRTVFFIGLVLLVLVNPLRHFSFDTQQEGVFFTASDSCISMGVLFAGDAMVHSTQFKSAYVDSIDAYNFNPVFEYLKPMLAANDLNVVNLETTLGDRPYAGYPNFSSPDAFAHALSHAGFNFLALANNHSVDKGSRGITRTLDVLNEYGITHTGTFRDSADRAQRYPPIAEINTIRYSVLNYTYGTNGIPVPEPLIVNLIDSNLIRTDIEEARRRGAEAVLVYFHWGNEYERKPNVHQRRIAEYTLRYGADIVIGSHPHVVQPVELFEFETPEGLQKRWVVWSLGNFVSNQRDKYTDGGIMVRFDIRKNIYTKNISITQPEIIPAWVYRPANPTKYFILPVSLADSALPIIQNMSTTELKQFQNFKAETEAHTAIKDLP